MRLREVVAAFGIWFLAGTLSAANLGGQSFDDSVRLANQTLQLNGLGERAVLFIKGYAAGLYIQEKRSSHHEVAMLPGPKRLQLRMLRQAGPDDFNQALVSGIRNNVSADEFTRLSARVGQLEHTITNIGATKSGDVINFDYIPELGTAISVNGNTKGVPISGADFYNTVLSIFIGEHPVDERLKRGLLGQIP